MLLTGYWILCLLFVQYLLGEKRPYKALILSILWYGCEVWTLSFEMRRRLSVLYHRCVRNMCHISLFQTRFHYICIRSSAIEERMGVLNL